MAALYLHNAIFTPEPSEIIRSSSIFPHSRNPSTATTTTLHGNASEQSHTHEPLLRSSTSDSWSYINPLSGQPNSVDEPDPLEWGSPPVLLEDPPTLRETKMFWEKKIRRRLRRLRYLMRSLEIIFGAGKAHEDIAFPLNNLQGVGLSTTQRDIFLRSKTMILWKDNTRRWRWVSVPVFLLACWLLLQYLIFSGSIY